MQESIPNHIAIIPDGNRRWAKAHMLQPWLGHKMGLRHLRELIEMALAQGVKYVTFWGASADNLTKRSGIEVKFLLGYIRHELEKKELFDFCVARKVNVRVFGRWKELVADEKLKNALEKLQQATASFTDAYLTILFGYDGKTEMITAVNSLITAGQSADEETLKKNLWTGHLPPVDLVVRTGGEPHWSAGFMMWLCADSQFYFTDTLWPDFDKDKLLEALTDFSRRGRRYGK